MALQSNKYVHKYDKFNSKHLDTDITCVGAEVKTEGEIGNRLLISAIVNFPYNKPYGHIFQHKNTDYIFTIMANHKFGLPYGMEPRLLFVSIMNEVHETQSPVLDVGSIYSKLISNLNISQFENRHLDRKSLYDQMLRFFSSYISYSYREQCGNEFCSFDFWQIPLKGNKENLLSPIVLTKSFYNELVKLSSLANFKIIKNICYLPIHIDVYLWLLSLITTCKVPILITWDNLINQINSDHTRNIKDFEEIKRHLLKLIHSINEIHEGTNLKIINDGLVLSLNQSQSHHTIEKIT